MKRTILIFFVILSVLTFSTKLSAQTTSIQNSINIEMVPEIPKAGESVTVFLNSFSINIDSAKITWNLNGKNIKSGIGEKTFTFTMGKSNERTTLTITAETSDGGSIVQKINLRPTSVDMIWESNGVVPPFYKGKSLFAGQDKITVIAVPHIPNSSGALIANKNLIFNWKKNGSVVQEASGYGKNTYTFEGSLIARKLNITVEVTSVNEDGFGFGQIDLSPIDPQIMFYEKSPTYGIQFQKALIGNVNMSKTSEIAVVAIPFYFNQEDLDGLSLVNTWSINGSEIKDSEKEWLQTFRKKEGVSGNATVSLSVENPNRILQFARSGFSLSFNSNNN